MDISKIVYRKSKMYYVSLVLMSIINGLSSVMLIAFINSKIQGESFFIDGKYDVPVFLFLTIATFGINKIFQTYMIDLALNLSFEFEAQILNRLKRSNLTSFLKIGNHRIITIIGDVRSLANFHDIILNFINVSVILLGCFGYLLYQSISGGLIVMVVMGLLMLFYLSRNQSIERDLQKRRDLENDLYRYLDDLLLGFREIKSSQIKNDTIHEHFFRKNRNERHQTIRLAHVKYLTNELSGNLSWYMVIGFVIFLSSDLLQLQNASPFLVTILYIMGPLGLLISLIPLLTNVRVALSRLKEFDEILNVGSTELGDETSLRGSAESDQNREVIVNELAYAHLNINNEKTFQFGPVNLTIAKGEILFIRGGNGSGKSTFINLLTGLIAPDKGGVYLGDTNGSGRVRLQSSDFACVFSSPHLMSENYEKHNFQALSEKLKDLIDRFQMDHVIKLHDINTLFNRNLSKGQQKRLALILALMEDKSIIILDEWASEQDPEFRKYFYETILPDLRRAGKTVIAVTHDDAYFSLADRIIHFSGGSVISDIRPYSKLTADEVLSTV